jgi:micrococcal nuclease
MTAHQRISALLVLTLLVLVAGCPRVGGSGGSDQGQVVKVVDGDTIDVALAGGRSRVRLLGIDTPESVKPNTPVQCFAREASARLHALLPDRTSVRLVRDVEERDRYGRRLAYVYRQPDGLFVNLDLVRGGYARVLSIRPNTVHAAEIDGAASEARRTGRGLWAACPAPASLPP